MTQSQVRFTGDQNGPSIRPSVVCVCPKMHSELYKINFTKFFVKLISRKNLQCKNPVFRNNQEREEISNQILIFKKYEIELTAVKWVETQVEGNLNNFFIFFQPFCSAAITLLIDFHLTVHRKQIKESPKYPYPNQNVLSICHN